MEKLGILGSSQVNTIKDLKFKEVVAVDTPYGNPSDEYQVYVYEDKEIYILARHGKNHQFAPHKINYRANIFGFHKLGVTEILSFSTVGGINESYRIGDLILTSDAIDFTNSRLSTFYDTEGNVIHIDMTEAFCPAMRAKLLEIASSNNILIKESGVYVCVNGPRFETPAEIRMYRVLGGDMVGMTLFPELPLARELGMCVANISLITDLASGMQEKISSQEIKEELQKNQEKIITIVEGYIKTKRQKCDCDRVLEDADIN